MYNKQSLLYYNEKALVTKKNNISLNLIKCIFRQTPYLHIAGR